MPAAKKDNTKWVVVTKTNGYMDDDVNEFPTYEKAVKDIQDNPDNYGMDYEYGSCSTTTYICEVVAMAVMPNEPKPIVTEL